LWDFCVHCDLDTLQWLVARGSVNPASVQIGHATLARTYNSDSRVAGWLETIAPAASNDVRKPGL
jgi:hypothetical protein